MRNHDCNLKMDEFCCVCVAEEIEAKDKRIAKLEYLLKRFLKYGYSNALHQAVKAEVSDG